jgi:hypothetical protein
MELDALRVHFTHSNTVHGAKKYTIYEIEVKSSSTIAWVIYKRYSHFYDLHSAILKQFSANNNIILPNLPPKRMTRSLAPEFVEKRKQELQEYLMSVLSMPLLINNPVILSFLEVPDSVRPMLQSAAAVAQSNSAKHGILYNGVDMKDLSNAGIEALKSLTNKSYEERKILELVTLLKNHPNRVAALNGFEEYFFTERPKMSVELIKFLLQGRSGSEAEGGIIQTCGDLTHSHVSARAALYLLVRLLDVEKNKDAQLFLDSFISVDCSVLKRLRLDQHILVERGNRLGAFKIIDLLKKSEVNVEAVVNDAVSMREYYQWAIEKSNSCSHTHITAFNSTNSINNNAKSIKNKSENLTEIEPKRLIQSVEAEIMKLLQDDSNWRYIQPNLSLNSLNLHDLNQCSVLCYKKDSSRDTIMLKQIIILPYPAASTAKLLHEISRRNEWDLKFHQGKLIQSLENSLDIVQLSFKSFARPYKFRDLVCLRNQSILPNNNILQVYRSVLHSKCPEGKNCKRAVWFPSAHLVAPLHNQLSDCYDANNNIIGSSSEACVLTFFHQLDSESQLIVSPDLLGESNELRQSLINLKLLLAKDYGYRALKPSQHTQNLLNEANKALHCAYNNVSSITPASPIHRITIHSKR